MEKDRITGKETEEEVARLKRLARKIHDAKLRQRYNIIRLFLSKKAKTDIADILNISLTQVYLILNLKEPLKNSKNEAVEEENRRPPKSLCKRQKR